MQPNLYLPGKRISDHWYEWYHEVENIQETQWIPLGRTLEIYQLSEVLVQLAQYIPGYLLTHPQVSLAEITNQPKELTAIALSLLTFAQYDSMVQFTPRQIWTAQIVNSVSLPKILPDEYPPYYLYPRISLKASQQGITNLMILTARQWNVYLRLMLRKEKVKVSLLTQAYPYAIGNPELERSFRWKGAQITPLARLQLDYWKQPVGPPFLSIRLLPGEMGQLIADSRGHKFAQTAVPHLGTTLQLGPTGYLQEVLTSWTLSINQYVDGTNLVGKKYGLGSVLMIAQWLVQVVAALHGKGWIHQQISPKNILRSVDGQFYLMDFRRLVQSKNTAKDWSQVRATLNELWNRSADLTWAAQVFQRILNGGSFNQLSEIANSLSFNQMAEYSIDTEGRKVMLNPWILKKKRLLGEGAFGKVYLVLDPAGREYAWKTEFNLDSHDEILEKISAYPNCNPNLSCQIASFYFYPESPTREAWEFEDEYDDPTDLIYRGTLYQLINGISLKDYLLKPDHPLPGFFNWLVNTVINLHQEKSVQHNDIHHENIMIEGPNHYKLIDFGEATVFDGGNFDTKSIGRILQEILKKDPHPNSTLQSLANQISQGQINLPEVQIALLPYPNL